ncbi:MAG: aldehyde dehydrogenase family protein [Gammaproteobacteria bacterium]|nr:MAG: aldehyde dehydrogenase family protein [Gammaproteobacteria bacterium]
MKEILSRLGLEEENAGAWIGQRPLGCDGGQLIDSVNPATGELIARVRAAGVEEYEAVMRAAHEAFHAWRIVPAPQRGEAVRLVGEALRRHKDDLGSLVTLEMGKIKAEGDGEVQEMIDIADFAVGQSRMLYGNTMHSERPGHRMYEQWHPLGVVGIISAFNFPVAVWSWNAFIAAVCGDISVWKPSPKTPLTAIAVQKICNEALVPLGLPPIFNLFIESDVALAERFVDDARVDLVSFTGSCAIGRQVGHRVAGRMGRSLLELGGNNAIIVDEQANLDLAIPAIVFGAVGTAGQRCTTTRRVLVHEEVFEAVTMRLRHAYDQISIGDPMAPDTLMGPLINQSSVIRFEAALEKVLASGGQILYGGHVLDRPGNYVEPTIVKAMNEWEVVQDETFAPILYLIPFHHLDEAISMQNGVRQGLSSAIFTDRLQHAEKFLSAAGSDCGIANVNIGTSGAEIGGAFGGEKETGGGREAGSDSWKAYMRRQTTTINYSPELPLAQGIRFNVGG